MSVIKMLFIFVNVIVLMFFVLSIFIGIGELVIEWGVLCVFIIVIFFRFLGFVVFVLVFCVRVRGVVSVSVVSDILESVVVIVCWIFVFFMCIFRICSV